MTNCPLDERAKMPTQKPKGPAGSAPSLTCVILPSAIVPEPFQSFALHCDL